VNISQELVKNARNLILTFLEEEDLTNYFEFYKAMKDKEL